MKAVRKKQADELIESFVNGSSSPHGTDSDEEFWRTLDDLKPHRIDEHCVDAVHNRGPGWQSRVRVSRASRLGAPLG